MHLLLNQARGEIVMMINIATVRTTRVILAAAAVAVASSGAVAQQSDVPEVKIEASRSVTRVGTSTIGAPIELVQVIRRVSYKDLDIATPSGATELQKRIRATAQSACKQLDTLYPLERVDTTSCVKEAVNHSTAQVQAAIASAERAKTVCSAEAPPR
jgi:UrcA family protein